MNVIKQIVSDNQYGQTIKMIVKDNERGPQGEQGEPGSAATITAGNAYTVGYGETPQVMNTGTASDATFDFYIPEGKPGAIHYTAGPGINITEDNQIEATGEMAVYWGDLEGSINNQTDLKDALNAKQATLTAGDAIDITSNVISAKKFTNSATGVIKGSADTGKVSAEADGTGSVNGWSALDARVTNNTNNMLTVGSVISEPTSVVFVDTANIADDAITTAKILDGAVTADKIDYSTIPSMIVADFGDGNTSATTRTILAQKAVSGFDTNWQYLCTICIGLMYAYGSSSAVACADLTIPSPLSVDITANNRIRANNLQTTVSYSCSFIPPASSFTLNFNGRGSESGMYYENAVAYFIPIRPLS